MHDAIALRWADALDSGAYQKGKDYLRRVDKDGQEFFCASGVLMELARADGIVEYAETSLSYWWVGAYKDAGLWGLSLLTPDVQECAAVILSNPQFLVTSDMVSAFPELGLVNYVGGKVSVAFFNDGRPNWSFHTLATFIRYVLNTGGHVL